MSEFIMSIEKIGGGSEVYSDSDVLEIGRYNGHTLYRKCYTFIVTENDLQTVSGKTHKHYISPSLGINVNQLTFTKMNAIVKGNNGFIFDEHYIDETDMIVAYLNPNDNTFQMRVGSSSPQRPFTAKVVLEYY